MVATNPKRNMVKAGPLIRFFMFSLIGAFSLSGFGCLGVYHDQNRDHCPPGQYWSQLGEQCVDYGR